MYDRANLKKFGDFCTYMVDFCMYDHIFYGSMYPHVLSRLGGTFMLFFSCDYT